MTDHNLWIHDIRNRNTVTSLSDVAVDDGFVATVIIDGLTTKSSWRMSRWDAYYDLRERLVHGDENLLPQLTTAQRTGLKPIEIGTQIYNITLKSNEIYSGTTWISVAGAGLMAKSAYGTLYQHNHLGSPMNPTTHKWISAQAGNLDSNNIIDFFTDAVNGDHLVVGADGAGDYLIMVTCDVTNSGNNETVMEVHINDAANVALEDKEDTSSTKPRGMAAHGIIKLSANDKISLFIVSTVPTDIIKAYDCHVSINRVS